MCWKKTMYWIAAAEHLLGKIPKAVASHNCKSLRLSLIDELKAADLLSPFHLRNSKMLVQEGFRNYSETNALLFHRRSQSSREVKEFPQGFTHDRVGIQTQIYISWCPGHDLSSICNRVWCLELDCLDSNPGSPSWATLLKLFNALSFSLLIWKLKIMLACGSHSSYENYMS